MADPSRILTQLTTGRGTCYVDLSEIVVIGSQVSKGGFGPSRRLALAGGAVEYISAIESNYLALRHLLGDHEPPWKGQVAPQGVKPAKAGIRRGRPKSPPASS
jgi:hypothetical protein